MGYFGHIASGFKTLLTGLRITASEGLKKPITQEYPKVKPEMSDAYRSAIKLVRFDETHSHDCVACMACVRICPSFCIEIEGGKIDGIKKKRATKFEMDFALCSLCGLCIDACPTTTLEYSKVYDDADYSRNWNFDLLAEYTDFEPDFVEQQKERERIVAEAKAKKAKAAAEAKAEKAEAEEKARKDAEAKAKAEPGGDEKNEGPPEESDAGGST